MLRLSQMALFIVIAIVTSSPDVCRGDSVHIGNGGGLSELRVSYSLNQLNQVATSCLALSCVTDGEAWQLAQTLAAIDPQVIHSRLLQFINPKDDPDRFENPEADRFRTAAVPGSAIYINRRLLYPRTPETKPRALTVGEALGLVVAAVAFQVQAGDQPSAQVLAAAMAEWAQSRSLSVSWGQFNLLAPEYRPTLTYFDWQGTKPNQLVLVTSDRAQDFTKLVMSRVHCPTGNITGGLRLLNAGWEKIRTRVLRLRMEIGYRCSDNPDLEAMPLGFEVAFKGIAYKFVSIVPD